MSWRTMPMIFGWKNEWTGGIDVLRICCSLAVGEKEEESAVLMREPSLGSLKQSRWLNSKEVAGESSTSLHSCARFPVPISWDANDHLYTFTFNKCISGSREVDASESPAEEALKTRPFAGYETKRNERRNVYIFPIRARFFQDCLGCLAYRLGHTHHP